MFRKYYFIKFGSTVQMLFNVRTEKGAIKKAEKLGEGIQVWYDHPDESWAARLVGVSEGRKAG